MAMMISHEDDAALMARACGEDGAEHAAFAALVERHKDRLVGYVAKLTGSRDRAEELAQESFVRLYEHRASWRPLVANSTLPWLFRTAANLVHSEERKTRVGSLFARMSSWYSRSPAAAQETALLAAEAKQQIGHALTQLPLAYRTVLVLFEIEDVPYDEIATIVGCPTGTVKSRLNRARGLMRQALAGYWNGE